MRHGHVASRPTCGLFLIVSPALKRWGAPGDRGYVATSDFIPRSKALGTPGGKGYVATQPTCGPLLILSPALKRWVSPRW